MRKQHLLIVSMALLVLLFCVGCSGSIVKEKQIKEDLESYSGGELC